MAHVRFDLSPTWTGFVAGAPKTSKFNTGGFPSPWSWVGSDDTWTLGSIGVTTYAGYVGSSQTLPHIPFVLTMPTANDPVKAISMPVTWRYPLASTKAWGAIYQSWWCTAAPLAISPLLLDGSLTSIAPIQVPRYGSALRPLVLELHGWVIASERLQPDDHPACGRLRVEAVHPDWCLASCGASCLWLGGVLPALRPTTRPAFFTTALNTTRTSCRNCSPPSPASRLAIRFIFEVVAVQFLEFRFGLSG